MYMYYINYRNYMGGIRMKSVTIRMPDELARRLDVLAKKTKRTKSFYVREILEKHLGEFEEAYLAMDRLLGRNKRFIPTKDAEELL